MERNPTMTGLFAGFLVAGFTGGLLQLGPPFYPHQEPLGDKVTLTLSADRDSYYEGQAVRLTLTLQNVQDRPVDGMFTLSPMIGKAVVYFATGSKDFRALTQLQAGRDSAQDFVRLDPGGKVTEKFKVGFEPVSQLPLLNEPGT